MRLIYLVLFTLFCQASLAETVECEKYKENNYVILRNVKLFTDSAVGFAGEKPEHYVVFECLLHSENGVFIFEELLSSNNTPAKLYGLLGLYFKAPEKYQNAKVKYQSNNTLVNTMYGCVGSREKFSKIILDIESMKLSKN